MTLPSFVTLIALFVLATFVSGCSTADQKSRVETQEEEKYDAQEKLLREATVFFFRAHEKGEVPSLSKEEHGRVDLSFTDAGGEPLRFEAPIEYPVTVAVRVHKQDESNSTYWYFLEKYDKSARWKMVAAWKTDSANQKVSLPLKPEQ